MVRISVPIDNVWSVTFSNFPSEILIDVVCQPVFGTLYGSFDFRGTFLFGLALFETGSLVCGVARSSAVFIVGRAVAGLGAAGVISGPLVLIAKILPMSKRPQYSSLILSMWGFASVAGPLVSNTLPNRKIRIETNYAYRWVVQCPTTQRGDGAFSSTYQSGEYSLHYSLNLFLRD